MTLLETEYEVEKGDFIGDYQVISFLGRGLFGETYHVQQNKLGKEFALKLIPIDQDEDFNRVRKLEALNALLGNLNSRFIDKVLASGRIGDHLFIVKDFLPYGQENACDLSAFCQKHSGKLSTYQAYTLAKQVLQGLIDAQNFEDTHHKGLFHGNLKPSNILISMGEVEGAFEVKLTDFSPYAVIDKTFLLGQKKRFEKSLGRLPEAIRRESREAFFTSLVSSYDYLPPEGPSSQGDLYSLGVILFEALTGEVPVPGGIDPELFIAHEGFYPIINGLLEQEPKLRFQKAGAALELLEKTFGQTFAPEEKSVAIKPIKSERRSVTPPGMVYIPAGEFLIGNQECGPDALPQHKGSSGGFYADRHLVTNQQFSLFVQETGYLTELEERGEGPLWVQGEWEMVPGICWKAPFGRELGEGHSRHPVVLVTYKDATAYADWLGRRLLKEEEWEYAAKGGLKDAKFPTGDALSRVHANFSSDGTTPVMHYPPNGYGLYDMAGNVWEWTESFYDAYPGNLEKNPHFGQEYRVVRGGAWMYDNFHCMVSFRNANLPTEAFPHLGFRTAADFLKQEK